VLEFFHDHLTPGDYIVIEDGVVANLPGEAFARYRNGPNRAVARFLSMNQRSYEIDESLCDRYGYNVTFCPNGWLRRTADPTE
jgi:cephalosporin hydroxylase